MIEPFVEIVGRTIRDSDTYLTKKELGEKLHPQIGYQTLTRILEYLEAENKILFDDDKIIYIYADNPKLKKLLDESEVLR